MSYWPLLKARPLERVSRVVLVAASLHSYPVPYFVSLCAVCFLQYLQYLLNSRRSVVFFRFFVVL